MRALAIGCTLVVAGCVSASPPASQASKDMAQKQWVDCLIDGAMRYDDGTSDPLSVGAVVASGCRAYMLRIVELESQGESRAFYQALYDGMVEGEASDGAAAVMTIRKKRQKAP